MARKFNPAPLRSYIDEIGDLPADLLLGRITMFTISSLSPIRLDWLEAAFAQHGLDDAMLPSPNKRLDAWKKATSDVSTSYPLSNGRTAVVLCRDVATTSDYVRRQITREIRDSKKKQLAYSEAITCTFFRPTNPADQTGARLSTMVRPENLEKGEVAVITQLAHDIEDRYDTNYAFLDAAKIRAMVRGYLKRLNAIEIRGGVYFVSAKRDEELQALAALINRFGEPTNTSGNSTMDTIPVVDMPRQRAFMARVFEREAAETLQSITSEVEALIESRKQISAATYQRMKARYEEVMAGAVEHMDTLQISQEVTAASADVALKSLAQLQSAWLASDGD